MCFEASSFVSFLFRFSFSLSLSSLSVILSQSLHVAANSIISFFLIVVQSLSRVQLFVTPWTVACQAPLFMKFSRQEYWSGLPFPTPGDLPNQGSNPSLLHCRQILYQLSYKGSPGILEWGAYPFSRGSSQPGIKPRSPALQVDSLPSETPGKPSFLIELL